MEAEGGVQSQERLRDSRSWQVSRGPGKSQHLEGHKVQDASSDAA